MVLFLVALSSILLDYRIKIIKNLLGYVKKDNVYTKYVASVCARCAFSLCFLSF